MKAELYNNYSKELIKKIPRGSTVMYKLTDIQPDPDNEGKFLIPAYRNVPSTDEIYDPVSDDYVQIAYITNVRADGEAIFGEINFTRAGGGCIVLNGNNPTHQKMYQYLELSNGNMSNKNRVTSKAGFFSKADTKADAILERQERKMILEAMQKANNLSADDVKFVASSLGMKLNKSEDELRNDVEEFAEFNPEDFLNITLQQTNRTESLVREAVDLRIITHNQKSAKFVWRESKKDIFTYKKKIGVKPFYEIAEYLQTENQEELEAIESRVLAKRDNP